MHENNKANNLDIMFDLIQQQEKTQQRKKGIKGLIVKFFFADIDSRIEQLDTQYLDGLHKFLTTYLDTVERTEPIASATPHPSTLLHTYFTLYDFKCGLLANTCAANSIIMQT